MHNRMNDFANGQQSSPSQKTQSSNNDVKESAGDYIDFEEIK